MEAKVVNWGLKSSLTGGELVIKMCKLAGAGQYTGIIFVAK